MIFLVLEDGGIIFGGIFVFLGRIVAVDLVRIVNPLREFLGSILGWCM